MDESKTGSWINKLLKISPILNYLQKQKSHGFMEICILSKNLTEDFGPMVVRWWIIPE